MIAVSCVLMLLTTFWMFAQDYNRSFKPVQRTFRDVESTIAERELIDKLPDPALIREKRAALKYARTQLAKEQAKAKVADVPAALEEAAKQTGLGGKESAGTFSAAAVRDLGSQSTGARQDKLLDEGYWRRGGVSQRSLLIERLRQNVLKAAEALAEWVPCAVLGPRPGRNVEGESPYQHRVQGFFDFS